MNSSVLLTKTLLPALDDSTGADHALKRLATLVGGIEHSAVFKGSGVMRGDQCTLYRCLALAGVQIGNL